MHQSNQSKGTRAHGVHGARWLAGNARPWALALGVLAASALAGAPARAMDDAIPELAWSTHQALRVSLRSLDEARRGAGPGRVECIDETVTQLHAILRQAQEHEAALRDSQGVPERHLRALRLLRDRLQILSGRGAACVPDEGGLLPGEVRVEALIPPPPGGF